jgi:tRNA-dihydrouridine synthase B
MKIGPVTLSNNVVAAPMAGVTDLPFRRLCRRLGAGLVVSEMLASDPSLAHTRKSTLRRQHDDEIAPRSVQIAGGRVEHLVWAARSNADAGAEIIDINMGCPAKKVCKVAAGSALLADEPLVAQILDSVVAAVEVPVTLKIRTGPHRGQRNALRIARIAEDSGVAALSIHGRTRACKFTGPVEYDTIRQVKTSVGIPVIANGDIATPQDAARVLRETGADGVMIGRAAQGNPWIFREVHSYLATGELLPPPRPQEVRETLLEHLDALLMLYGTRQGVRVARKHLSWYCRDRPGGEAFWQRVNRVDCAREQRRLCEEYLHRMAQAPEVRAA